MVDRQPDPTLAQTDYFERVRCHVCGKRRMCKMIVVGFPVGVGWSVCREHGDWQPQEGVDFTAEVVA